MANQGYRRRIRRLLAGLAALALLAGTAVFTGPSAGAIPSQGTTEQVSVADNGSQVPCAECDVGDPSISADGRYVAFATSAPLDASSENTNVYVRDRQAPGHTILISRAGAVPANGVSQDPAISADGRYVAFDTTATNIVATNFPGGDATKGANTTDLVICDRDPEGDGVLDKPLPGGGLDYRYIIIGNLSTDSGKNRLYSNYYPTISADGSTVASQQNSVSGDGAPADVVVSLTKDSHGDLQLPPASAYIDIDPAQNGSVVSVGLPRLSPDGHHVAFVADYLPASTASAVFPLSTSSTQAQPGAFAAGAATPEQTPSPPGCGDAVEVVDTPIPQATVVSVDSSGAPLTGTMDIETAPAISRDGSVVAFGYLDRPPCGAESVNTTNQVIVVDRDPGHAAVLGPGKGALVNEFMASVDTSGRPSQGGSDLPALSADGRYLAFQTEGPDMDNGPSPNGYSQIVQRDLVLDQQREQSALPRLPAELASACDQSPDTCQGNATSLAPALDANGGVVAFLSSASNLVSASGQSTNPNDFARQYLPTVTASPLAFGTIPQGTAAEATVAVSQVGFGPVPIGSVSIAGPDAADFSVFPAQSCAGVTLYEAGQCFVSIRYAPRGPGSRTATLTLATPTPVDIPLSGGAGPPINGFQATPNPLVFPGQRLVLSPSAPQTVTVANTSQSPFTITGVLLPSGPDLYPEDYAIIADTCQGMTLEPGQTCQVYVINVPLGAGLRPAALAFTDTTGGSPQIVGLSAVGTVPTVQLSPAVTPGGRATTVHGEGFPANYPVTVGIPAGPAAPTLQVSTTGSGAFSIGLPVFGDADVGTWPVQASAVGLNLSASAPLLIVLGTYQPPDFTTRH